MNARPLLICLLATLAASNESCVARAADEAPGIRVTYDSSVLYSAAAANHLLRRIEGAALLSCGASPFSLPEYRTAMRNSTCVRKAVADAVRQIGSPLLTAAVDGKVSHE